MMMGKEQEVEDAWELDLPKELLTQIQLIFN